jgi:hypothetical protein
MGMGMAYNTEVMEQILLNQNKLIRQQRGEAARVQAVERAKKSKTRDPHMVYELCRAFGWTLCGPSGAPTVTVGGFAHVQRYG